MWQQLLHGLRRHACGLQLLPRLRRGLSLHQSFSLSQEVCSQDLKQQTRFGLIHPKREAQERWHLSTL